MKTVLYRVGSISIEDIERVIGKIKIKNKEENAPNAPGMLSKHYAPRLLLKDVAQFKRLS
jgi:L-threonylcarbamoyladenylate synthase